MFKNLHFKQIQEDLFKEKNNIKDNLITLIIN